MANIEWIRLKSGILIPFNRKDESFHEDDKNSYVNLPGYAEKLQALFFKYGVKINSSEIEKLIKASKDLGIKFKQNQTDEITPEMILGAILVFWICNIVLPIDNHPKAAEYLKILKSGTLNLLNREESKAKNLLWELSVWGDFKRMGVDVELAEPDIYVKEENLVFGIACKKLYSEKHVSRVLSDAVHQISQSASYGLIAVNLDDVGIPKNMVAFKEETFVINRLRDIVERFLKRYQHLFAKYYAENRLCGVMVGVTALMSIPGTNLLKTVSQRTVWSPPGLDASNQSVINRIHRCLEGHFRV